jgi:hypothetical protein
MADVRNGTTSRVQNYNLAIQCVEGNKQEKNPS